MGRTHNLENTFARTADPLGYVDGENILNLVQSILALQRDYGDRKTRRLARMKYVINDMGIEWFATELKSHYFNKPIHSLKPEPKSELKDYLGWHRQSKGLWFVGIHLLSGRLSGKLKTHLKDIVELFKLEIRLTPNQDLLLCNIGNHQKSSVRNALEQIGIAENQDIDLLNRHALACPALPLCGLALTEAERTLPDILNRIKLQLKSLEIKKPILIRMTGCPNGCARPYMAELALVGSGKDQYQLWLGGSRDLKRLAKPYVQRMPIDALETTLEPLFTSWKNAGGPISLGDHVKDLGDQVVSELLSSTHRP